MTEPVTARQAESLHAQIKFLTRDGGYRIVCTDSESPDGLADVCTSPEHPEDDRVEQLGVYDCCDTRVIETGHEKFAAFIVGAMSAIPALLAERDALLARVAELEVVDPETVADIKVAEALARYKAGRFCPDCGCPRTSLAHGTRCLTAPKERDV